MNYFSDWWLGLSSEFVGTMILIVLGNGVCSAVSFKGMAANQSGRWILIAFGWGLAVFAGASASIAMKGDGLLNPAILAMQSIIATKSPSDFFTNGILALNNNASAAIAATFFVALIFEFLGAMVGQIIVNFINTKFIRDNENSLVTIRGVHSTSAVYKNKKDKATIYNFSYELVGTLILGGLLLAFGKATTVFSSTATPILAMLLITSIGISLGSATGFALNPARDLGPRIVFSFLVKSLKREGEEKKGIVEWNYSWVPVLAPMVAGIIIGLFGLI